MRTTFYLASSSLNKDLVRNRAAELQERGLSWVNEYVWMDMPARLWDASITLKRKDYSDEMAGAMARDVSGAVAADVFVLLQVPDVRPSKTHNGVDFECGARIGANKEAHVIIPNDDFDYEFFMHPCVVVHRNWEEFMLATFPFQGIVPPQPMRAEVEDDGPGLTD